MLWLLPCVTTLLCVFRECIIPDISRTFHFGVSGNTMNPYFHDRYFKNHVINRQTDVALKDINRWVILWCVCGSSVNLLVTCHSGACVGDMCQCMCWHVSSCATSVHVLVACVTSVCADDLYHFSVCAGDVCHFNTYPSDIRMSLQYKSVGMSPVFIVNVLHFMYLAQWVYVHRSDVERGDVILRMSLYVAEWPRPSMRK